MEEANVEIEGCCESRVAEIAVLVVVAQQGRAHSHREDYRLRPLVDGQLDGVVPMAIVRAQPAHRIVPRRPGSWSLVISDFVEQVGSVEQNARVDVPRHSVGRVIHDVRRPNAGEIIGAVDHTRGGDERVQGLEGVQGGELRHPGVAQLRDVGGGVANHGGQQLLVRRRERDLLDADVHSRMRPLERRHQRLDDFAFVPERPEP